MFEKFWHPESLIENHFWQSCADAHNRLPSYSCIQLVLKTHAQGIAKAFVSRANSHLALSQMQKNEEGYMILQQEYMIIE